MSQTTVRVEERAPKGARSARFVRRAAVPELIWVLGAGALPLLAAVLALELWDFDLRVPFAYLVDGVFYLMVIKGVLDHGWIGENPNLGAPFGQQLWDFPSVNGDALQLAIVKGFGVFTHDPALVMNLFFLLTFPLTGVVAFLVLRALGVSRGSSLVCGVLYALLPFHFERDEHIFFASYYTVPLGCYLALSVLRGTTLFSRTSPRTTAVTFALCAVIGAASTYYGAFTLTMIAIATLVAVVAGGGVRALASGAATIAAIGVAMLAFLTPTFVYWAEHGENNTERRRPIDTEFYSLKLPQLVLPVAGHRVQKLAELRQRYDANFGQTEGNSNALGAVTTIGLFVLLGTAIAAPMRRRREPRLLEGAAAITVGVLVVALTGGLAALFSLYVNPQIRAWNRVEVFIGFFALLAVALLLDRLRGSLRRKAYGGLLAAGVLALVLIVGALDQTTRPNEAYRAQLEANYHSDASFFKEVESRLGRGDVFQFPDVRFPEFGSVIRMSDYDHARGYLHTSKSIRWSYGAQKGRPEDWTAALENKPAQQVVAAAVAAGFDGVYVDRAAYADGALGLDEELRQILQVAPLVSSDQRLVFYDARPFAQALQSGYSSDELDALRLATLKPLEVEWADGFYAPETHGAEEWRWAPRTASVGLRAEGSKRRVLFRAVAATSGEHPYPTTVRYPDGEVQSFAASSAGVPLEREFVLRPGLNLIQFATEAPPGPTDPADTRALHLRLVNASITEPAVEAFSPEGLRRRIPLPHFTDGWYPPERDYQTGQPFRWMGTRATLGVSRGRRPSGLILSFPAISFGEPRTLTARLGKSRLAEVRIPAGSTKLVQVPIPPRQGDASIQLTVEPAAQPSAPAGVQPGRLLGLRIYEVALTTPP
jgi:phosphoglycerol transferase